MSEQIGNENLEGLPSSETDVVVLIKQMQQRLTALEKKIDILISQSQEKSFRPKPFSKPFRSFDRHDRFDRGKEHSFGERKFSHHRPDERRPREEGRSFGYKKKSYDHERPGDFNPERRFDKPPGGEHRGFSAKKKPFFHKHRDRE